MSENYGIIIGVQHYKGIDPLEGPHNDAADFEDWLRSSTGGNVPANNCMRFTSLNDFSKPLQHQIDEWFGNVYQILTGKKGLRLYCYFSGHGLGVSWNETALLLPNWSTIMRNAALSSKKYIDKLIGDGVFEQIYFFMDCCSNRLPGSDPLPPSFSRPMTSSNPGEHLAIYASEFDTPAFEAMQLNDTMDNSLARGLFTQVLLEGLKGAAAGPNGLLTVGDLVKYVKTELPEFAKKMGKTQYIRQNASLSPDVQVIDHKHAETYEITILFNVAGPTLVLENTYAETELEINTQTGSWSGSLRRGNYWLRKQDEERAEMKIVVNGLKNRFTYG
jgi:hypothetical protein